MTGAARRPWDAIVLVQMGGPTDLAAIEPFLAALFSDPDIIRLPAWVRPLQPWLARTIARRRAPKVRPRYEAMGGGSPLGAITQAQARSLEGLTGIPVHVAMRYTVPRARDVVKALGRAGARRALILPLYPHHSISTTASSLKELANEARLSGLATRFDVVRSWGSHPAYVDLLAVTCEEALKAARSQFDGPVHLVLSAHGVPVRYIDEGDTYRSEVEETARLLQARLTGAFESVRLGYQSAVGPVRWIGPDTASVIDDVTAEGGKALVVAPLGFVSDHIETMYDMDTLYRAHAASRGVVQYQRAASFNARPEFARVLDSVAMTALDEEASAWTS